MTFFHSDKNMTSWIFKIGFTSICWLYTVANFYCDISMHAYNVWRSVLHSFPLYLWRNSAENLPFSNQLLWCLYFLQWVKEINENDWQKHAWGLLHNSMSPVSGCIPGKSHSHTIKQQGFFTVVETIWKEQKIWLVSPFGIPFSFSLQFSIHQMVLTF